MVGGGGGGINVYQIRFVYFCMLTNSAVVMSVGSNVISRVWVSVGVLQTFLSNSICLKFLENQLVSMLSLFQVCG